MKITEVIGSFPGRDQEAVAPFGNLMQRIANQFTGTGQVKLPLDFQPLNGQSATALLPFSSMPSSREDIPAAPTSDPAANAAPPLNGPVLDYGADLLSPTSKGRRSRLGHRAPALVKA